MTTVRPGDILQFWTEAGPDRWFKKDGAFDSDCRRFEAAHLVAARREFDGWAETAEGALALVLLLDQSPATSTAARPTPSRLTGWPAASRRRPSTPAMTASSTFRCATFYLPFEHSGSLSDQERCVALSSFDPEALKWAVIHRNIIARFGRFPHRNPALGRETTPEEAAFLSEGGFAG